MPETSLAAPPEAEINTASHHRRSVFLVFCCTLIGAVSQMLIKTGAAQLAGRSDVISMLTNAPLFAGYALYGVSTLLLVIALKGGELSRLYPIIALTYVWVTFLSITVLKESMNVWKGVGVALIVIGVSVLGRKAQR